MPLFGDSELAITESVPELDRSIPRSRNDLSVIGGEGNGENIVGVSNKSSGGSTGRKLPETKGLVPRGRKCVGAVGGDYLHSISISPSTSAADPPETRTQSETM